MTKEKLAGIVSVVFDPLVEAPLLLVIFFLTKRTASLWLLPVIAFFGVLLPLSFLFYGLRHGFISDWETTKRNERHSLNFVCLFVTLLILALVGLFGDQFLLRVFVIFLALMAIYTLITFFWKISGHMTANTAFILTLNLFFDWQFWYLIFLLPLVAWARLVRNKHDICQILGGVFLATLVILCGIPLLF